MAAPAARPMKSQTPDPPPRKQVNKNGGIGFQDGVHHHHHHHFGGYPTGAAATASRDATNRGITIGRPVTEWDPAALGVRPSITVDQETTLTPYLVRPHDQVLRDHLTRAKNRTTRRSSSSWEPHAQARPAPSTKRSLQSWPTGS